MASRLRSFGQKTLGEATFNARLGFSRGLLPTCKEVLEVHIFHLTSVPGKKQLSRSEVSEVVGDSLKEHWLFQNIYTVQKRHIVSKVSKLYEEFLTLTHTSQKKRTPAWKEKRLDPFLTKINSCFDIPCKDSEARKRQEKFHGVSMSSVEYNFLQDQLGPRLKFCLTEVDKSWAKTAARCREDEVRLQKQKKREIEVKEKREARVEVPKDIGELICSVDPEEDRDYTPADEEKTRGKKRRFEEFSEETPATLPPDWRHLRVSERKVRLELAGLIVGAPSNSTVTLHYDGSRAQGCGGYSLSGVTVPSPLPGARQYFPFPTLPIARETRENLADLKLTLPCHLWWRHQAEHLEQDRLLYDTQCQPQQRSGENGG